MPKGYRLLQLALGGWLAFGLPALSQQDQQAKPSEPTQAEQQKKRPLTELLSRLLQKEDEPNWASPKCANPKNHDEADLCQQIRMAEAAEGTLWISKWQLVFGGIGIAFVIVNIVYARRAARAAAVAATGAVDAANATRDSVIETRRIGEAQVRAYLSITRGFLTIMRNTRYPQVIMVIKNTGNSPARRIQLSYRAEFKYPRGGERTQDHYAPSGGRDMGFGKDLAAGEQDKFTHTFTDFAMTTDEEKMISEGPLLFEAMLKITFTDAFGIDITEEQDWMGVISPLGTESPFVRIPFTRMRMHLGWPGRQPKQ
jgi:hypothetical protein